MQRYVSLQTNSEFKAVYLETVQIRIIDDIMCLQTEYQGATLESKEFQYDFNVCKREL